MNNYEVWRKGFHEELINAGDKDFLRWVANYGLFNKDEWTRKFLSIGRLKRAMWERLGKKTLRWCPLVELRMPFGCTARCKYCVGVGARDRIGGNPHTHTKASLLEAIKALKFPETVGLCADWGDPCLHPEIIEAVNERIENEWLVTRYTCLTNLSVVETILKALPYTRSLIIHFTMSKPHHAKEIMGYKKEDTFGEIYNNIKLVCNLKKDKKHSARIRIVFIVEPATISFISDHYGLFKDFEGLTSCMYKASLRPEHKDKLFNHPGALEQKKMLEQAQGEVSYEWRV